MLRRLNNIQFTIESVYPASRGLFELPRSVGIDLRRSRRPLLAGCIELQQDQEIPFLDVLMKRQPNNSFSTSIYRKKTSLIGNGIFSHMIAILGKQNVDYLTG